jgi:hypothetical protein
LKRVRFFAYVAHTRNEAMIASRSDSTTENKKAHHMAINESLLANDIFCFTARPQGHHVGKISKPSIAIKAVSSHE